MQCSLIISKSSIEMKFVIMTNRKVKRNSFEQFIPHPQGIVSGSSRVNLKGINPICIDERRGGRKKEASNSETGNVVFRPRNTEIGWYLCLKLPWKTGSQFSNWNPSPSANYSTSTPISSTPPRSPWRRIEIFSNKQSGLQAASFVVDSLGSCSFRPGIYRK